MPVVFALADSNTRPIIIKTSVRGGELISGKSLSALYSVGELKEMTLFYGQSYLGYNSIVKSDCESGKLKTCDFGNVDLSEFNGKSIDLLFKLTDMKNTVYSKKVSVKVDSVNPVLNDFSYNVSGKKVTFFFDINEKNFKEILYTDNNDCNMREEKGTLCRSLRSGKCSYSKNVCIGTHNFVIDITDKAGNIFEKKQTIIV
ncbi:Uncharacterised protein [uncultured archaeon]|nr:Uncharacterised protein [uncultured archaeon]